MYNKYKFSKKNPFKECGIYILENINNGHVYIGQSVNIWTRWRDHIRQYKNENAVNYKSTIYNAMRKYSIESFIPNILEICRQDELDEKEIFWIAKYDSYHNGYNETLGGDHGIKIDRCELLKMYNNGIHDATILAKHFDCKRTTIFKILNENGIINERYIQPSEEKEICDYYLNYCPSLRKMKKHFNRDQSIISNILKKHNIDIVTGSDEQVLVYGKNGDFICNTSIKLLRKQLENSGKSANNIRTVMNSTINSKHKTTQGLILRYYKKDYPKHINLEDKNSYWNKDGGLY